MSLDLSVVIVSWNTRSLLDECLASVVDGLDGLAAEVFVVDNGSTDGSAELVRTEYPTVQLIANETNRGFAAANNQALRVARGRYALLLNADTVVLDDVLAQGVLYLDEHPDVAVVGCRVLNPDRTLQPTCFGFPTLLNLLLMTTGLSRLPWPRWLGRYQMRHWDRDDERDVDVVTGCFMLVRQEAMEAVGLLDEAFPFYGEETDWCTRFRNAGWPVRFSPFGEIIHYGGAASVQLAGTRLVMLTRELVRLHQKHGGWPSAVAAWCLLFVHNATRAATYRSLCWLRPSPSRLTRAREFSDAIRHTRRSWPAGIDSARVL